MADLVLQITDGTTTIDLDGSGDYTAMADWRPRIPQRRRGVMGNQLPWEDVIEEIPVKITGADIDDVVSNEASLANLIDQAQRWQDGENVDAVVLKYRTQDSTITNPLQSTILGTSGDPITYMTFPEYGIVNHTLQHWVLLRFVRLGVWLGDEESQTSSSDTPMEILGVTFTNDYDLAIVRFDITHTLPAAAQDSYNGFLVSAHMNPSTTDAQLYIDNVEDANWTSGVNTAATTSGNVARSGADIAETNAASGYVFFNRGFGPFMSDHNGWEFFLTTLLSDATTVFKVTPIIRAESVTGPDAVTGRDTLITSDNVDVHSLGTLFADDFDASVDTLFGFTFERLSGSGTMQMDTLLMVTRSENYTNSIYVAPVSGLTPNTYALNHRLLTKEYPHYLIENHITSRADGNLFLLSTGQYFSLVLYAIGGSDADNWRYADNTSTVDTFTYTAYRRPIYLVPQ